MRMSSFFKNWRFLFCMLIGLRICGITNSVLLKKDQRNGPSLSSGGHLKITTKPSPASQPGKCITRWSAWLNRHTPVGTNGDFEKMTPDELHQFCPGGTITGIECQTSTGISYYSSGEMLQCSMKNGLICKNDDNFPMECSDYEVKYECDCDVTTPPTTATPTYGSTPTSMAKKTPTPALTPGTLAHQAKITPIPGQKPSHSLPGITPKASLVTPEKNNMPVETWEI